MEILPEIQNFVILFLQSDWSQRRDIPPNKNQYQKKIINQYVEALLSLPNYISITIMFVVKDIVQFTNGSNMLHIFV